MIKFIVSAETVEYSLAPVNQAYCTGKVVITLPRPHVCFVHKGSASNAWHISSRFDTNNNKSIVD